MAAPSRNLKYRSASCHRLCKCHPTTVRSCRPTFVPILSDNFLVAPAGYLQGFSRFLSTSGPLVDPSLPKSPAQVELPLYNVAENGVLSVLIALLRNFSIHSIHMRLKLLKSVPYPGTPHSSDLALLDRQPPNHPGSPLIEEDVRDLQELFVNPRRVCMCIDVDGWYQPAIDTFGHAPMGQFSKRRGERA
ncbi:hypothetical protein F5141DRAFT_82122 [Pisolithus sp. B1]|nr:hypothetical protein F5141DRAFT_82122 [Pisolithus sp. B1]